MCQKVLLALEKSDFKTIPVNTLEETVEFLEDPSVFLVFLGLGHSMSRIRDMCDRILGTRPDVQIVIIGPSDGLEPALYEIIEKTSYWLWTPFPEPLPVLIAKKAWELKEFRNAYFSLTHVLTQEQVFDFMSSLAEAIDAKSPYTRDHSERVAALSRRIAREMKLPDKDVNIIYAGALLHDLGKVGIPDAILDLDKPLNEEQKRMVQEHPIKGEKILSPIPSMYPILPIVRSHHENWDGSGYPDRLKGEEIHLYARIVKVADSYDAVTSFRPYRKTNLTNEQALEMLAKRKGTEFDPAILDLFLSMMERITAKSFA